jgi:hypothetical protein
VDDGWDSCNLLGVDDLHLNTIKALALQLPVPLRNKVRGIPYPGSPTTKRFEANDLAVTQVLPGVDFENESGFFFFAYNI